ncbi:MAG: peptidylprolyl isomerase [Bacteroidia bacterium]|nr:peptidylprolyl isomerase [Bacteroidia bacterium]
MKNKFLFLLSLTLAYSQPNDPVVMKINDIEVRKSEFEQVYKKNNPKDKITRESLREYADLYALFRMKVAEAKLEGLDTLMSFKNELAGYRRSLAAPYLSDKNTNENLLTEAYERLKEEIKAAHILVRISENAYPKDTLEAYMRISIYRDAVLGKMPSKAQIAQYEKLLLNTTDVQHMLKQKDSSLYFAKLNSIKNLEKNYKQAVDKFKDLVPYTSDDAGGKELKGDLGYFSAFDMVYPFENAAYSTPVGQVSKIIRTRYGYHILKVYDRRPNRGEVTVAHIMARYPKDATPEDKAKAKRKIDSIVELLKKGENFEELARKVSDDKQTSDRGGILQPFRSGRLPASFEDVAFSLEKNGDVGGPVETPYGWHVIKRIDKKLLPPFESMKSELKMRVNRDSRSLMGRKNLIARLKKEYGFKENKAAFEEFSKVLDSTFLKGTWSMDKAKVLGNKELFKIGNKSFTQNDFALYLERNQTARSDKDAMFVAKTMYPNFVEESIIEYEDSQLENKYPEFKAIMREYHDGILIFDITDRKVWSKAVKDTVGLKEFYEKNKQKYLWDERADVHIYTCKDEKSAALARKLLNSGKREDAVKNEVNKKFKDALTYSYHNFFKGENKTVDENWRPGIVKDDVISEKDKSRSIYVINRIIPKEPKKLNECRGPVSADYQLFLEEDWVKYMKNKYKVTINEDVLYSIN